MEDQQPEPGDLTDQAREEAEPRPESEEESAVAPAEDPDHDPDGADQTSEEASQLAESEPAVDNGAPTATTRRNHSRWAAVILSAAAVLFVASAGFAGAMLQPYLADRALVATKLAIARTATNTITTLWSYTPDNIDTLADRAAEYLADDFAARYRKDIDSIASANKQAEISVDTDVVGVAVESVDNARASAIVYTNTTSTSPQTKDIPALQFRSYRVSLVREHGRWLTTELLSVTRFSLTPQL